MHSCMRNEQWIFDNNSSDCIWSDWKINFIKDQIQENCAGRTFMNTLCVNSLLITYAGVQRWNWTLQLPMDSTFK